MRVFYADTGLTHDLGHHANACRLMSREWRRHSHEVMIAAAENVFPGLQGELGANPHFRVHTYWHGDGDPFCGWLTGFFYSAGRTEEDFQRLGPFTPADLLYINSIQPAQLMAVATFLQRTPPAFRPRIVAELGTGPGLDFEWRDDTLHFHPKDPRYDPKALLYRFASTHLVFDAAADPILVTFHPTCSAIYSHLLHRPVHTVPVPHQAMRPPVSRVGRQNLTLGILGHQRSDKGFQLVPQIAELLLQARPDLRILVHNGAPNFMVGPHAEMRALAAREPRITLDERVADQTIWDELMGACDAILCPYHGPSYTGAYSAVVGEALSQAIPVIVPGATTLSRTLAEFGGAGTVFGAWDPPAIVAATEALLADFDRYAALADDAALRWKTTMGAANTVNAILSLLGMAAELAEPALQAA